MQITNSYSRTQNKNLGFSAVSPAEGWAKACSPEVKNGIETIIAGLPLKIQKGNKMKVSISPEIRVIGDGINIEVTRQGKTKSVTINSSGPQTASLEEIEKSFNTAIEKVNQAAKKKLSEIRAGLAVKRAKTPEAQQEAARRLSALYD